MRARAPGENKWAKVSVPKAWDLYDEALWAYEDIGWYTIRIV
jgi:hypothetical protein